MDKYFIPYLLLPETTLMLLPMGFYLLGGVIAALTMRVRARMTRLPYLWAVACLMMIGSLSNASFLVVEDAAAWGLFGVMIVAIHLTYALAGAGLFWASAARANDIWGKPGLAWMGFVPLANLVLMFTGSDPERPAVTGWRALAQVVLVLVGIGVLVGSRAVNRQVEILAEAVVYDPGSPLAQMMTENMTYAQSFANEASYSDEDLPLEWDVGIELRRLHVENDRLVFSLHETADFEGELGAGLKDDLAYIYCAPDIFGRELDQGGELVFVFYTPAGDIDQEVLLANKDCL